MNLKLVLCYLDAMKRDLMREVPAMTMWCGANAIDVVEYRFLDGMVEFEFGRDADLIQFKLRWADEIARCDARQIEFDRTYQLSQDMAMDGSADPCMCDGADNV